MHSDSVVSTISTHAKINHVLVTNKTGTYPRAEESLIMPKGRLFDVPCRDLGCVSIWQIEGEGTYKRHSNVQVRVQIKTINDM